MELVTDKKAGDTAKPKKVRVLPIKIIPPGNWQFSFMEIKIIVSTAHSPITGKYLNIKSETVDDYHKNHKFLLQENVQIQSYVLKDSVASRPMD